ncbi:MAG: ATP-binding protein, partial [Solirubrobacteraceae bacterium]
LSIPAREAMAETPNVRLRLSNRAENVLLVRQALSGLAETVGLDAIAHNDVSTAVTEACNNVILHAYSGGEGPLDVELTSTPAGIDVVVRDRGIGISPAIMAQEEVSDGIGLPVIQALSDTVEFRDLPGSGTEVVMHFEAAQERPLRPAADGEGDGAELEAIDRAMPADLTVMTVAPTEVARSVVPRVLSTLAARAYFSTDRISDTQLLADALVEQTNGSISSSHLSVGVSVAPRNLELRVGPLHSGRADELFAEAGPSPLGDVLERLSGGHTVSAAGTSEMLALRLAQRS